MRRAGFRNEIAVGLALAGLIGGVCRAASAKTVFQTHHNCTALVRGQVSVSEASSPSLLGTYVESNVPPSHLSLWIPSSFVLATFELTTIHPSLDFCSIHSPRAPPTSL